jgi:hypothetical protein
VTTKYLAKFESPRAITRSKIIGPERNVNLICNLSLYTHTPNIKSLSQSLVTTVLFRNYGMTDMSGQIFSCHHFFSLCLEILTWFGLWVYSDELQIKFTFRSGPMIFGWVMALTLKFGQIFSCHHFFPLCLEILTWFLVYECKMGWQLNIWPNFKVQGP